MHNAHLQLSRARTPSARWSLATAAVAIFGLAGCSGSSPSADAAADGTADATGLQWYKTCGAPVCQTGDAGTRADGGAPACTTEEAGESCTQATATCDPGLGCNVLLVCADKDPRVQSGGCPISRRASKMDIAYLDDAAIARLADEVRRLRLATYRYKDAPAAPRLGFMIDDAPYGTAVDGARDQIDLYAYLSMTVAALQSEMARVDAQERELGVLRRRLEALTRKGARR
jgi:hypothetical protein